MGSPPQSDDPNPRAIAEVLEKMWARYLPDILERVGVLQQASAALTSGSLSPTACDAAESAAHKLAGTLGTFGCRAGQSWRANWNRPSRPTAVPTPHPSRGSFRRFLSCTIWLRAASQ